jgi:hypothetical protein
MLDRRFFNQRRPADYERAAQDLPGMDIVEHRLESDDATLLTDALAQALAARGYSRQDLLAGTHLYVGRKRA